VERVFDNIVGFAKNGINFVIRGVNKIGAALNKIPDIKVPGLGKVGVPHVPKIPELAAGGVTRGATTAVLGEAGREAVLPLKKGVFDEMAKGILRQLAVSGKPALAGATTGRHQPNITVEKIVVQAPEGKLPDPTATAVKMARVLERRGGSPRQ
jgi:phage-related minor tail protein